MTTNGQIPLVQLVHVGGGQYLRPDVAAQWGLMRAACKAATGVTLGLTEGYRAYSRQVVLYQAYQTYLRFGRPKANVAAVPGTSNHGLGTALDLNNYEPAWAWLQANAPKYGFTWTQGKASGERWHWVFAVAPTIRPASGSATPISAPTSTPEEPLYITALEAGGSGFARAGHIYSNDIGGHWRALTNLAGDGYVKPLAAAGKLNLIGFRGNDLELLFATDGIWEQVPLVNAPKWSSGANLIGLGPLTGRLMYPGAAGISGQWHYPYGAPTVAPAA
jgi:hypothetical protein